MGYPKEISMAYHIKDKATDRVIRELAALRGMPIVDAIREACANEIARQRQAIPLAQRLKPIQEKIAAAARTDSIADKAFFDDLSGDL
jgi:antitoxin VapB